MDLKQLEWFVRVAELGSFTRAASTLDVSQSVLSRQVRALEIEVRQHLLYRNGRGASLTESGKTLLAHAKGILYQVEVARQELEDQRGSLTGKVVVGVPPSMGRLLTVPVVTRFRKMFGSASIGIVEGLTVSVQEWLLLGRLDFALLYDPPALAPLQYEQVWSGELCLVGAPDARPALPATVRLADLSRYPLIMPSRPHAVRSRVEAECARHGVTLSVALEIDAIASILDLVQVGSGYAILSRHALAGRRGNSRFGVARIVRPSITSEIVIATSNQRPLTHLARRTIDLVKAEIAATASLKDGLL
jgi:LysR family transcriptional regulator, nitrogen assimilation regulatory protein